MEFGVSISTGRSRRAAGRAKFHDTCLEKRGGAERHVLGPADGPICGGQVNVSLIARQSRKFGSVIAPFVKFTIGFGSKATRRISLCAMYLAALGSFANSHGARRRTLSEPGMFA